MYENDYILRTLKEISEFIAKIILNKNTKNFEVSHSITDTTLKEMFGISRDLLINLPTSSTIDLIRGYNHKANEPLVTLSQLLIAEGDVFESEGKKIDAKNYYLKAMDILSHIILQENLELNEYVRQLSNEIIDKINTIDS